MVLSDREARRARAVERSREAGYRGERPGVFAVSKAGCDHFLDAYGACMRCRKQVVWAGASQRR
jgi:hypothetical protein